MKLSSLSVERFGICKDLDLADFCPGINLIYGRSGSGKSTIRQLIRAILYGTDDDLIQSYFDDASTGRIGSIQADSEDGSLDLCRSLDESKQGLLQVSAGEDHFDSLASLPGQTGSIFQTIDQSTYTSIFSLSFEQKRTLLGRIVSVLRTRLSVATGESGQVDRTAYDQWQRQQAEVKTRLDSLEHQIHSCQLRRNQLQTEIDSAQSIFHSNLQQIENEIRTLTESLNRCQSEYESLHPRQLAITTEIDQLQTNLERLKAEPHFVPVEDPLVDQLTLLFQRLDEIEDNLRRWQGVQAEIQKERVHIRDEANHWQEIDLDSSLHPYHECQKIIHRIEGTVEAMGREAATLRDDSRPEAKPGSLARPANDIKLQLFELCQELENRYKHVRHRSAVAELKQLRRCHREMSESINRLNDRRALVIAEIRSINPQVADAILHSDPAFTECAEKEGYLSAHRRFLASDERDTSSVMYQRVEADLSNEANRLAQLKQELGEIEKRFVTLAADTRQSQSRLDEAVIRRSHTMAPDLERTRSELSLLDEQIRRFSHESTSLRPQLGLNPPKIETLRNPVIEDASSILSRLTSGLYTKLWMDSTNADVRLRQRDGVVTWFGSITRSDQALTCLALALAAAREFQRRGCEMPLCLDELLEETDVTCHKLIVRTLAEICREGLQVFLFTQSEIDLADGVPATCRRYQLSDPSFGTNKSQGGLLELPTPLAVEGYPYSQPADHLTALKFAENSSPADFRDLPLRTENRTHLLPKSSHLASIDQSTLLRNTSLIDEESLLALRGSGIHSISDLLDIDPDLMDTELTRHGISSDSIGRWQSQTWLRIAIPELSSGDSLLLVLSGIVDPIQLDTESDLELRERIEEWIAADHGEGPFMLDRYTPERLANWRDSFSRNRSMWRNHQRYLRRARQRRRWSDDQDTPSPEKAVTHFAIPAKNEVQRDPSAEQDERPAKNQSGGNSPLKFYLNLSDDLEAAPSIGPRTAERFANIGVVTVQDFLDGSSEQMATEIDYKRIKSSDISNWQNQCRLVCQIPNLRGHDAQLLVACDATDPAEIADMQPQELLDIVGPFSRTKEGKKILRQSDEPDLEEVTGWINSAKHTRPIRAAA